jgi:hypothetical protein
MSSNIVFSKSISSSVGLFVYPAAGQTTEKQELDDYQCFTWARDESGHDPISADKPEEVAVDKPGADGSGVRGALRGAARGALLGEVIDDDAGKGAEIGAAVGIMRARSKARKQAQQQAATTNLNNEQQFVSEEANFKKAMSLCLEARGYSVK